jgi:stage II sporulation protein AA (anti-sigma F factor antagonist)
MTAAGSNEPEVLRAAQVIRLGVLTISSERDGDLHTVELEGELDLATAPGVELELERVEATDAAAIILDLSGLTFIDSTGIRLVLAAARRSRADSNRLTLLRGTAAVQRAFEISGVEGLLSFAD